VRAAEPFNSMSVIKVPIMVRAFLLAEQGRLSLDERVTITRAELRDGTGCSSTTTSASSRPCAISSPR